MNIFNFKSAVIIFSTILLALVAMLWSWNTLSELFGGPHVQFKHAIAAISIILLAKWTITLKWKHLPEHKYDHNSAHNII
jgi:predicted Co/Zn/Cd cation transporter (cation efflux family)